MTAEINLPLTLQEADCLHARIIGSQTVERIPEYRASLESAREKLAVALQEAKPDGAEALKQLEGELREKARDAEREAYTFEPHSGEWEACRSRSETWSDAVSMVAALAEECK